QRGAPRRGCRRTAWRALRYARAHALRDHHRGGAARLDHAAWREHPTLARDATFATLMIVLNGMVGTALLMGALRIGSRNIIAFLVVIASLAVFSLIIPNYTKTEPGPSQAPMKTVLFASITVLLYVVFVIIQTLQAFFAEPSHSGRTEREHAVLH